MRQVYALLCCCIGFLIPASATTIIPYPHLGTVIDASDAVVAVRATHASVVSEGEMTWKEHGFDVIESFKGPLTAGQGVSLRPAAIVTPQGPLAVPGDFEPEVGLTYLVFLDYSAGYWRPVMYSYYVFESKAGPDGADYWVPVNASLTLEVLARPDGQPAEPLRVYARQPLLDLISTYVAAAPGTVSWNGAVAATGWNTADFEVADRALPIGCDFQIGPLPLSRFKFPMLIEMYYDPTAAPANAEALITGTINYMNTNYPGIFITYGGAAEFAPDCSDNTVAGTDFTAFENTLNGYYTILVFFEDPCNQIVNINACAGPLGVGGSYQFSTTHVYKGDVWQDAAYGYVVVNNGVPGCLSQQNFERFLAHETTHAFKMDHLDAVLYPNQNMNPLCCNAINVKDKECMNYVYEPTGQIPVPVELVDFTARTVGQRVALTWETAVEVNTAAFIIQRSTDGIHFDDLLQVTARNSAQGGTYEVYDEQPWRGTNYYRLVEIEGSGNRQNLGVRVVTVENGSVRYALQPNPVDGKRLLLSASAGLEAIESIEIYDAAGRLARRMLQPAVPAGSANQLEIDVETLPRGVFWLRVMQQGQAETVKFVRQ
jgi:hypothetical protein